MRDQTLAVHAGGDVDTETGAVAPPLHLSTTFAHGPAGERRAGFEYQREDNPTQARLESALATMEHGQSALVFGSGMAAMSALLEGLPAGSEILIPDDCYTGLRVLAADFLAPRGITSRAVDMSDIDLVRASVTPSTRLIWSETPSNPRLKITDVSKLAEFARGAACTLVCDNTFATPVLQNPLDLGAEIVMHSTTKYFGGHSDVMGGALVFAQRDAWHAAASHRRHITGGIAAPFNSWLILRGCRSLHARMAMHCANAQRLAEFLAAQPGIERVNYPGLPSHPGHSVAMRQMRGGGGMLSVELQGGRDTALSVAGRLRLFTNATSLGGTESLVEHRASVEGDQPVSPQNLLRVSAGLEHPEDMIEDWAQALA